MAQHLWALVFPVGLVGTSVSLWTLELELFCSSEVELDYHVVDEAMGYLRAVNAMYPECRKCIITCGSLFKGAS